MSYVGSHYCPVCQRQAATTVVAVPLPRTAMRMLFGTLIFAVGMVLLPVFIGFWIVPRGLSLISNATTAAHRCDFCGSILAIAH